MRYSNILFLYFRIIYKKYVARTKQLQHFSFFRNTVPRKSNKIQNIRKIPITWTCLCNTVLHSTEWIFRILFNTRTTVHNRLKRIVDRYYITYFELTSASMTPLTVMPTMGAKLMSTPGSTISFELTSTIISSLRMYVPRSSLRVLLEKTPVGRSTGNSEEDGEEEYVNTLGTIVCPKAEDTRKATQQTVTSISGQAIAHQI